MPKKETNESGEKEFKAKEVNTQKTEQKSENPETKQQENPGNATPKDSSAKLIFGDPDLCAQFLRDYVDIPMLKEVQPEDIKDVTERYIHMFTNERNSDIVKEVTIKNNETPFF